MDWHLSTAARTLYQEARGEPLEGQRAVAAVIVNRLRDGRWGANLASVCLWHGGFSGWFSPRIVKGKAIRDPNFSAACGLLEDSPALLGLAKLLTAALNGEDPTGGATHYYAPKVAHEPAWVKGYPDKGVPPAVPCGQFGTQLFFKNVR